MFKQGLINHLPTHASIQGGSVGLKMPKICIGTSLTVHYDNNPCQGMCITV